MKYFKVGGCVRDYLLGQDVKDIDLVAIGGSFDDLSRDVVAKGGKIFVSKPEYLTIRCKLPDIGPCDIRLARKDGDYSDCRRPDQVFVAEDIKDDVLSRDFTINALLQDIETGEVVDYVGGQQDIIDRVIRCVGAPEERIREDALRIMRAIRFSVTKGFVLDYALDYVLKDEKFVRLLEKISPERIYEELFKMFRFDTLSSWRCLNEYELIRNAVFGNDFGIWLMPTMKKV